MFLDNKYSKYYYSIVQRAKSRTLSDDIYTEKHHIIPHCFYKNGRGRDGWLDGDPDSPANIITVTAREHYICHRLLPKMTSGRPKYKMISALLRTAAGFNHTKKYIVKSREYALIKKHLSEIRKGQPGWSNGKKLTNHITKAGKLYSPWNKGKSTPQKGKTYDDIYGNERAEQLKRIRSVSMKGKPKLESTKKIWSDHRKGKNTGGSNSNASPVIINGVQYSCKKDACAVLNISLFKLNKLLSV